MLLNRYPPSSCVPFNVVIYGNLCIHFRLRCPCHFVVKFWLSGSLRVRVGVKTSLVTDTENETVLTAP